MNNCRAPVLCLLALIISCSAPRDDVQTPPRGQSGAPAAAGASSNQGGSSGASQSGGSGSGGQPLAAAGSGGAPPSNAGAASSTPSAGMPAISGSGGSTST